MELRDEIEAVIRAWHLYEVRRGSTAVVDFDCYPSAEVPEPASSRLEVYREFLALRDRAAAAGATRLVARVNADIAYLRALLGERPPLADYVRATQGCSATGWADTYITACGDTARAALADIGIGWGPHTDKELREVEGPIAVEDAPDAIREAVTEHETAVRRVTGTDASFQLTIESTNIDSYWSYWLDGAGDRVRLRLNLQQATFTKVAARQFALHEVLGHGLQGASWHARCTFEDVPWVRLMSVHANQQVLLEGLAQAMPLFVTPDDQLLTTRVRLDHYTQLVRGELHLAWNSGATIDECAQQARERVPYWTDAQVSDFLTDRSVNPQLRTYLWAYPAGFDWFANLAVADHDTIQTVLRASYSEPLSPDDLANFWPSGPAIGGSNHQ
ncbi:hypothetical protein [Actinopolymorpha alba]|uniref:hypothetical protein n=1 Tax=Actinopolymorpha alba TaxID=533267 RepID=UPI0003713579|nr:hypothetical protein [Actinopolymorpha alba]